MSLIAAQYNGVHINLPEFNFGVDNQTEEFLKMNPMGKVPVMMTPDGPIFESTAMARYVARIRRDTGLMRSTFYQQAQVDQWIDWSNAELLPALTPWYYTVMGWMQPNMKNVETSKVSTASKLAILNEHLAKHTFMVGERLTLADIIIVCDLFYPMKFIMDAKYRAPYPSLMRWFLTCVNQVVRGPFVSHAAPVRRGDRPSGPLRGVADRGDA